MEIKDFCTGVQHIGIPTNNIKESIDFYKRLGFSLEMKTQNGSETVAFLKMHDLVLEIYENMEAVMHPGAINHIALDVKDIDTLFALVKKNGFELVEDKVSSLPFWDNGIKYFIISGPNKERIEFCEIL